MDQKEKCEKHGEVSVWIVCKHVGDGSADTVIFSENRDALCFACANEFKGLTEQDVVAMCEECLKDFTAKLMINSQSFANLQNRIIGVEYLNSARRGSTVDKGEL
jgi:hypothetical protein